MQNIYASHENKKDALAIKAYLKNLFECFGIKAKQRRNLQNEHNKSFILQENELLPFAKICFENDYREMHHYGLETIAKNIKKPKQEHIALIEFLITHKSWWDTVDMVNSYLTHNLFMNNVFIKKQKIEEWTFSENMWLRRSAIIGQLKFKQKTDTQLLHFAIKENLNSKEFFINKAIGWALREYSKTNAQWVIKICNEMPLHSLSKREALRLL